LAVLQVTCIRKRGGHYDPHERIQAIAGSGWEKTEDQAIREIKGGINNFKVTRGGRSIAIVIASHLGRQYLKTESDGYRPDNLLALPDCA
jgi:hypothetical protein